jgi:hypothetical protein
MNASYLFKSTLIVLLTIGLSSTAIAQKEKYHEECTACFRLKEKASKRKIYSEIIIDAPISKVWQVLTDFAAMPSWSSTFQGVEGEFLNGSFITAHFKPDTTKNELKSYGHTIIIDQGKMFGWKGDVFALGMSDNHKYILQGLGDGQTKFIQSDECIGGMAWLLGGLASKKMLGKYVIFNREFKARVETLVKE